MDRNEAASVIRKYLTCTDITHSCNGKCKACRYHTNDDEKELALRLAIAALDDKDIDVPSKEIIHCKDCKFYGRADKRRFYRGSDCLNKRIDTIVPDRDFCSRAEKRGDLDAAD